MLSLPDRGSHTDDENNYTDYFFQEVKMSLTFVGKKRKKKV